MKRPHLIAALTLVTAAAGFLWAAGPRGMVTTVGGVTYEGEVTESDEQVIVRNHGVDTVLARQDVAKIDYTTYADRFEAALKGLKDDDTEGKLALAKEAFDRREYALAQKACDSALEFDPLNRDARQLDALINSQIHLEGRADAPPSTKPAAKESSPKADPNRPNAPRRLRGLNDAQINRIRQVELRPDDDVRIQFRENVRKRFVDAQPDGNYRAFATRTDVDQALAILASGTPDMIEDVVIRTDPRGIRSFGKYIQPAIVQGCATANCHGGNGAGNFRLMAGVPDAATMITNFYLLTQYTKQIDAADAAGIFTPSAVPMIDRGNAKNSLLYQYALPRARARQKHPPVRNWDGLFRQDDDRLAQDLIGWMDVDLARLKQPNYGFTFTLNRRPTTTTSPTDDVGEAEATSPTSMPASAPAEQEQAR